MRQWEYSKLDLSETSAKADDIDLLADAGRDGWELIGITSNNFAYLKRPLIDVDTPAQLPSRPPARRKTAS